jgi:hypothetical protein
MSPPPNMPAPGSPASRVDITPETVDTAARHFATGQQDLIEAYKALSQQLSAHSAGMAGFDKAAHQFAGFYDPAAKAAFPGVSHRDRGVGRHLVGADPHNQ